MEEQLRAVVARLLESVADKSIQSIDISAEIEPGVSGRLEVKRYIENRGFQHLFGAEIVITISGNHLQLQDHESVPAPSLLVTWSWGSFCTCLAMGIKGAFDGSSIIMIYGAILPLTHQHALALAQQANADMTPALKISLASS